MHLTTNKAWYIIVFWKVFSQESSEGHITLRLNVMAEWWCCINVCISALNKNFCKMLKNFHCFLKNPFLGLSPLASVSQSTCRGQNTFNSPEVSTKKNPNNTAIWMRTVCKNIVFPMIWKHCLLVMSLTDEAYDGVLPPVCSFAKMDFRMRHAVLVDVFLKRYSQI